LTGTPRVRLGKQAVVVFCADNGVVAEGVTQTDASVTATMAGQIRDHRSSVCRMAAAADAEVFPVDMGMLHPVEGVEGCHIADGTGNIALGPAMTREQACLGISYGIRLVKKYADLGYEVDGNTFTYWFQFKNQIADVDTAAELLESRITEDMMSGIVESVEEECGVTGITCCYIYYNADGTVIYQNSYSTEN